MAISTLGDMRQHFLTARHNTFLKTELNTLVQELTSGEVADVTSHLGPDQTHLSAVDRQLEILQRFSQANSESAQLLSRMQTALSGIDDHRAMASSALLTIDDASSQSQVKDAAAIALSSFSASIKTLNMRSAERAMFGGNNISANPLADADQIMDALRIELSGLTDANSISDAIEDWFDTTGGGFETVGYLGDASGFITRAVEEGQTLEIGIRADDPAIRDTLKSFAKAALAGDPTLTLDLSARKDLQMQSGVDLLTEAASLASLQGRLGYAEGQVEQAAARTSAQMSSFGIMRNDLVSSDPFETATRLQSVQLQLETHYTLTARLSRLSLTEYLR